MWYVYVLEAIKNKKLYTGYTNDLEKRLIEHNKGFGSKYTKAAKPFRLIFYEAYLSKKDACKAEKFFKSGYGREILNNKLENYLKNK